jgi:tubulin monoglycylase TTLL3/8
MASGGVLISEKWNTPSLSNGTEEVVDESASLATGTPTVSTANLKKDAGDDISPISKFNRLRDAAREREFSKDGKENRTSTDASAPSATVSAEDRERFESRNKNFLKNLAEKKRREKDEDRAAAERLRAYKEKLKADVLKRLSSSKDVHDSVQSKLNKISEKRAAAGKLALEERRKAAAIKKGVAPELTEEEKQKRKEAQKAFQLRHAQYLENIAKKKQEEAEAQAKSEESQRQFREKLANKVKMQANKSRNGELLPPPGNVSSNAPMPVHPSNAAGSGASAVRTISSSDDKRAREERIRKRQQGHIEKTKKLLEDKAEAAMRKEELYDKRSKKRKEEILQYAQQSRRQKSAEDKKAKDVKDNAAVSPESKKAQAKKAKEALNNFMSRLAENNEKRQEKLMKTGDVAEEMDESRWRRAHGIEEDTKIFITTGFYPSLTKALRDRGWYENPDRHSRYFDLKWTINSKHIDHHEIQPHQIVNHFARASSIVTKIGIMKNLRNLKWFANVSIDRFFPRCYDLNDLGDKDDFCSDFKCVEAESILKRVLLKTGVALPPLNVRPDTVPNTARSIDEELAQEAELLNGGAEEAKEPDDTAEGQSVAEVSAKKKRKKRFHYGINVADNRDLYEPLEERRLELLSKAERNEVMINPAVLRAALRVVHKMCQSLDDKYLDAPVSFVEKLVEPNEWGCINPAQSNVFESGEPKELPCPKRKAKKVDPTKNMKPHEKRAYQRKISLRNKRSWKPKEFELRKLTNGELCEIMVALDSLRINPAHQTGLNGNPSKNVWIIKPAGKSRGRGIQVFDSYEAIMDVTDSNGNGQESQWVAQKYIENPLTILRRKFDIRQWVLVTDWNPLTLYFYSDSYLRFCATDYSLDDLSDKYIHLANNSVAKKSKQFKESPIEGNMWHSDQFIKYLGEEHGSEDLWKSKIQRQMKKIVAWSTMSVQDMVQNRNRSCELYGYDFMIDEKLDVWLIEVNSSPAMDYSTPVTERLVKEVLPDTIKVLADYEYTGGKKKPKNVDLGKWELIYRAKKAIEYPRASLLSDLTVEGSAMKVPSQGPRRNRIPGAKKKKLLPVESDEEEDRDVEPRRLFKRTNPALEKLAIISPERAARMAEAARNDEAARPHSSPKRPVAAGFQGSGKFTRSSHAPRMVRTATGAPIDSLAKPFVDSTTAGANDVAMPGTSYPVGKKKFANVGPRYLQVREPRKIVPAEKPELSAFFKLAQPTNPFLRVGEPAPIKALIPRQQQFIAPNQNARGRGIVGGPRLIHEPIKKVVPVKVFNPFAGGLGGNLPAARQHPTLRVGKPARVGIGRPNPTMGKALPVKTFDPFHLVSGSLGNSKLPARGPRFGHQRVYR